MSLPLRFAFYRALRRIVGPVMAYRFILSKGS